MSAALILAVIALLPISPTVERCDCEQPPACYPTWKFDGRANPHPKIQASGGTPPYVWTLPVYSFAKGARTVVVTGDVTKTVTIRPAGGTRTNPIGASVRPPQGTLNAATDTLTVTGTVWGCLTVTDAKGAKASAHFEIGF